jgi:magnesium transporter
MTNNPAHLDDPVLPLVRKDYTALRQDVTVGEALIKIRQHGVGEKVVYFYVVDEDHRLAGVLPTRRLLTAPLEKRLAELMVPRVVAIPQTATVLEACEAFLLYKFLAFPVVDERRRIVGVVDVGLLTQEVFDLAERAQTDAAFEAIGLRVAQMREASPGRAFRFRSPWLLATITSGVACALLTSVFETTLAESLVLAFFLTLVLGLGESVATQSLTLAIQTLRATEPTWSWYAAALRRELGTALLLGLASGLTVAAIVWLWRDAGLPALVIGGGIMLSICSACALGLSVPTVLHALRLDPKIASGPVTLALADIMTLLFYFTLGRLLLGGR